MSGGKDQSSMAEAVRSKVRNENDSFLAVYATCAYLSNYELQWYKYMVYLYRTLLITSYFLRN